MKKITLCLTLALLAINPLKPASAEDSHTERDEDEDFSTENDEDDVSLKKLEAAVLAQIKKNIKKINENTPIPCKICGKKFNRKSMQAHMRIHTGEKPFKCTECPYASSNSSNLNQHQRICQKAPRIPIPKAAPTSVKQTEIDSFNALQLHSKQYTKIDSQSFSCNLCYKTTTTSSDMINHFTVHDRMTTDGILKNFMCPYCQLYYFTHPRYATRHENFFCLDSDSPHMKKVNNSKNTKEEEQMESGDMA